MGPSVDAIYSWQGATASGRKKQVLRILTLVKNVSNVKPTIVGNQNYLTESQRVKFQPNE